MQPKNNFGNLTWLVDDRGVFFGMLIVFKKLSLFELVL